MPDHQTQPGGTIEARDIYARDVIVGTKISTTVYITEEQNEKLKALNKKTKVPIAEYIRQGIDMALEKYKDDLPGQTRMNF